MDMYLMPRIDSDTLETLPKELMPSVLEDARLPIGVHPVAGRSIPFSGDADPTRRPPLVSPVPEPTTWVMMILGFFGLGAILRKRRVSANASCDLRG